MVWLSSLLVQLCYCAACSELGEIIAVSDAKLVLFLPPVVFSNVWCQHLSPGAVKSQNIETVPVSEGYSLVAKQLLVFLSFSENLIPLAPVLFNVIKRYVYILFLTSPLFIAFTCWKADVLSASLLLMLDVAIIVFSL